jgi:transposase
MIEPDTTACPCCAGRLHKIGEDVSEVLDVIPAILRVLRTIRPKYACRGCTGGVMQAKMLPRLIESGMASTALVSHVVVSKFAWYLPLYRQVQILAGQGVHLDRATLAGWVKRAAWWLKSLYELQLRTIQASPRLFCDETPINTTSLDVLVAAGRADEGSKKTPTVVDHCYTCAPVVMPALIPVAEPSAEPVKLSFVTPV